MTRQPVVPRRSRPANEQRIFRLSILGAVLLCALIALLLGDSLIGVYRLEAGEAIPRGWRWLLGADEQSFGTQTVALLLGVVLMGFAFGGLWFLLQASIAWLRDLLGR
jgi:hypothetical protein